MGPPLKRNVFGDESDEEEDAQVLMQMKKPKLAMPRHNADPRRPGHRPEEKPKPVEEAKSLEEKKNEAEEAKRKRMKKEPVPSLESVISGSDLASPVQVPPKPLSISLKKEDPKTNPYLESLSSNEEVQPNWNWRWRPKEHMGHGPREIRFVREGTYTQKGEELREAERMEELKRRIEEHTREAGMDEIDVNEQVRRVRRDAPPAVEWWDEELSGKAGGGGALEELVANVTNLVQHPMKIPSAVDAVTIAVRPMDLTRDEMKRMRRRRRLAEQQEKQDRIRLGLLPPEAPKVRLKNMLQVLTSEAVMDPTKVEERVRREVEERHLKHQKENAERKLSADERREKIEDKKEKDAGEGLGAICFALRHLTDGRMKFKVYKNAEQDGLTGCIIYHPRVCLVYVEGGRKGLRHYRRLMTHRIDWAGDIDVAAAQRNGRASPGNVCLVAWEGENRVDRAFKKMEQVSLDTVPAVKEYLMRDLQGLWDVSLELVSEKDEE